MKAEFHGSCEVVVVCECGANLKIEEIQHKGSRKTLYVIPCKNCENIFWHKGYDSCEEYYVGE